MRAKLIGLPNNVCHKAPLHGPPREFERKHRLKDRNVENVKRRAWKIKTNRPVLPMGELLERRRRKRKRKLRGKTNRDGGQAQGIAERYSKIARNHAIGRIEMERFVDRILGRFLGSVVCEV